MVKRNRKVWCGKKEENENVGKNTLYISLMAVVIEFWGIIKFKLFPLLNLRSLRCRVPDISINQPSFFLYLAQRLLYVPFQKELLTESLRMAFL